MVILSSRVRPTNDVTAWKRASMPAGSQGSAPRFPEGGMLRGSSPGFYGKLWPANHNRRRVSTALQSRNCGGIDESSRPLAGLGSGEWYESRFLRKCIDGGHAGIGHRRRAVGNQDFLRRVNGQKTGVAPETSGQKRSATTALLQRRRSLLFQLLARGSPGRSSFPTRINTSQANGTAPMRPSALHGRGLIRCSGRRKPR